MLFAAAAQAQDAAPVEVRPGSPLLDGTRVPMRTDTFKVNVDGADGLQLVLRTAALGDTALLRVERTTFDDTEVGVDSFAVRTTTLAPLYGASRDVMASSRLRYPPGRVEGTYTPAGGEKSTISERLTAPVFYGNSTDLVLASLPLEAGRSFDLAMWTPTGLDGVISARVAGAEEVPTAEGARCTAWRVETVDENGGNSTYWIEESTRSLVAFSSGFMQIRILRHGACRPGQAAGASHAAAAEPGFHPVQLPLSSFRTSADVTLQAGGFAPLSPGVDWNAFQDRRGTPRWLKWGLVGAGAGAVTFLALGQMSIEPNPPLQDAALGAAAGLFLVGASIALYDLVCAPGASSRRAGLCGR